MKKRIIGVLIAAATSAGSAAMAQEYPVTGPDGTERWYLIHRGQVRAVCAAPATDEDRARTAGLLAASFAGGPEPTVLSGGAVDSVLLVVGWFRRHAGEKQKLMTQAQANRKCEA